MELISNCYTVVTTRMISALRWASDLSRFTVSLIVHRAKSLDSVQKSQFVKRKVSRSGGVEPASFALSSRAPLPPGQAG